jgi:diguanylate cyclase (GGDEF)-like protein
VLLREVDQSTAQLLADRIRQSIELAVIGDDARISATVSIGLAIISASDRDVQDMIERADQGLYVAKNTGRNCCFFMQEPENCVPRAA